MDYDVASSLSWSKLVCNLKMGITRISDPLWALPLILTPNIYLGLFTLELEDHTFKEREMKERKTILMLPPMWIMMLLHLQVGLSTYNCETCITSISGASPPPNKKQKQSKKERRRSFTFFKGENFEHVHTSWPTPSYLPQWQAPRFPHDWLQIFGSPDTHIMTGWTIGGRPTSKSSARV